MGWIPEWGRSFGGGHGRSLQYFCLENPIDRGDWRAAAHSVGKSQTRLKRLSMPTENTYSLFFFNRCLANFFFKLAFNVREAIEVDKIQPLSEII